MAEGYFSPWGGASERDARTCRYSIGTLDGHHLWCECHRLVVVFPCGLWEREAGADEMEGRLGVASILASSDELG